MILLFIKSYMFYFNLNTKVNIVMQHTKLKPVIIINKRSEIITKAYKNETPVVNVQRKYELILALAIFLFKSLIVGKYAIIEIIPVHT